MAARRLLGLFNATSGKQRASLLSIHIEGSLSQIGRLMSSAPVASHWTVPQPTFISSSFQRNLEPSLRMKPLVASMELLSLFDSTCIHGADISVILQASADSSIIQASSVLKKRRRRMNHHKHKKWLKKMKFRLKREGRV